MWGIYVGAMYWFLNGALLRGELDSWKGGDLQFSKARSWFPGYVVIDDFDIRHQDPNVEWTAKLKSVRAFLNVFGLLWGEFRFSGISADDGSFRFRLKSRDSSACVPEDISFPRELEINKKKDGGEPWRFSFSDIQITNFNDIWFDCYRFVGKGGVSGGFRLFGGDGAVIEEGTLSFEEGKVLRPTQGLWVESFSGVVVGDIKRFYDKSATHEIFSGMSGRIVLKGQGLELGTLNYVLNSAPQVVLEKGVAAFDSNISYVDGVLNAGSTAEVQSSRATVKLGKFEVGSGLEMKMEVKEAPSFVLKLTDYSVGQPKAILSGDQALIRLQGKSKDITRGMPNLTGSIEVKNASVDNLEELNRLIPKVSPFQIVSGSGNLDLFFSSEGKQETAQLEVNLAPIRVRYKDLIHQGRLNLALPAKGPIFSELNFKSPLARAEFELTEEGKERLPLKGAVSLTKADLDFEKKKYSSRFRVSLPQSELLQKIVSDEAGVPSWILDVSTDKQADAHGMIRMSEGKLELTKVWLESGSLNIRGGLCKTDPDSNGAFLIWAGPAAVAIEFLGKQTNFRLQDAPGWYKQNYPGETGICPD